MLTVRVAVLTPSCSPEYMYSVLSLNNWIINSSLFVHLGLFHCLHMTIASIYFPFHRKIETELSWLSFVHFMVRLIGEE